MTSPSPAGSFRPTWVSPTHTGHEDGDRFDRPTRDGSKSDAPSPAESFPLHHDNTHAQRHARRVVVIGTLSPDFSMRALRPVTLPSGRTDDAYATVNGGFQD
ncbi:hypothetical protein GO998_24645 (plasmid) [Ralstonia syzygii]|uniref:Uncharacterized protein n=1 Tax=Ralstonia syzygii TaxID=28097 RepID=A0ABX7ZQ11_9RALS|nr:hypothetical protein [Ralstonia syzygii]QUP56819.1 hypothetical protein GO998_24645 [Ralstonia syzygii]